MKWIKNNWLWLVIVISFTILVSMVLTGCATTKPTPTPLPTVYKAVRVTPVDLDGTRKPSPSIPIK